VGKSADMVSFPRLHRGMGEAGFSDADFAQAFERRAEARDQRRNFPL
jgi:hypothetical protein